MFEQCFSLHGDHQQPKNKVEVWVVPHGAYGPYNMVEVCSIPSAKGGAKSNVITHNDLFCFRAVERHDEFHLILTYNLKVESNSGCNTYSMSHTLCYPLPRYISFQNISSFFFL